MWVGIRREDARVRRVESAGFQTRERGLGSGCVVGAHSIRQHPVELPRAGAQLPNVLNGLDGRRRVKIACGHSGCERCRVLVRQGSPSFESIDRSEEAHTISALDGAHGGGSRACGKGQCRERCCCAERLADGDKRRRRPHES
jgi:hypothetical protein